MRKTTYKTIMKKLCILGSSGILMSGGASGSGSASTNSGCTFRGLLGSNPGGQAAKDTDGDGFSDSAELSAGTDSFDPLSHP